MSAEVPKTALIVDCDRTWSASAMQCLGRDPRFPHVEAYIDATFERVQELSARPWGLVVMNSVGLIGKVFPLAGLVAFGDSILDTAVLVVSYFSSPIEGRDAVGLGATYYISTPDDCSGLISAVDETLKLHKANSLNPYSISVAQEKRQDYLARFGYV